MKDTTLRYLYRFWSQVYDRLVDPIFRFDRKYAVSQLKIKKGQKILEIGVGTGLNLAYYPSYCIVIGIDLSRDMLEKAKKRAGKHIRLQVMDAAHMRFKQNSFDGALMTFALRVIPDQKKALKEVERATTPKAKIVIYDNFGRKPFWDLFERIGWGRNYILEDLIKGTKLKIIKKEGNLVILENGKS